MSFEALLKLPYLIGDQTQTIPLTSSMYSYYLPCLLIIFGVHIISCALITYPVCPLVVWTNTIPGDNEDTLWNETGCTAEVLPQVKLGPRHCAWV